VLIPKKLGEKNQPYFWTKEWQEAERAADKDIKAGRITVFQSVDELIKDLG
jgi:hypothetical protein